MVPRELRQGCETYATRLVSQRSLQIDIRLPMKPNMPLSRAVRTCSMFHALVVFPLAFRCINLAELNNDKVWGTHPREGELLAFASG